eukprot:TRINITY_DN7100_c0_g1_i1.p1 TRINITY_DN7100_c0_g1~~TRINITY_DN7100_c0_g1_i1.p1  ORF type:complete len:106 (+),score=32.41 TRINITY_DN7100_c0_g1_i1:32-319(+)
MAKGKPASFKNLDKQFQKNGIHKNGKSKKKEESSVAPWIVGIIMFILLGSSLFQLLRFLTWGKSDMNRKGINDDDVEVEDLTEELIDDMEDIAIE